MKKIIFIFALIFATSCSDTYSTYKATGKSTAIITPVITSVDRVDVVDWNFGVIDPIVLSKGIRLKIDFPKLKVDSIEKLTAQVPIDSWIVRIIKVSNTGREILGHFVVPMIAPGSTSKIRTAQMEYGVANLFYAAAAISKRFENFKCPAFNHQFYIDPDDIVLQKDSKLTKIIVSPAEEERVYAKLEAFGYSPTTINAGTSLVGEYRVDIALFDSAKKIRRSSILELPETVVVKLERNRPVKGCSDFEIPPKEESDNSVKDFKFGH